MTTTVTGCSDDLIEFSYFASFKITKCRFRPWEDWA